MTLIKALLQDQVLTLIETPVIASGGVEEDAVRFDFGIDAAWEGYTKKAVFYRDESDVYHVDIGSDNTAVIPWEVLQQEGFMFLGVFGTKGSEIKTSTVARYRVENGAITIGSESQPTPNFFADIIANTAARHTHDNKEELDGITAEKIAQWDDNAAGATFTPSVSAGGTLSWTNNKGLPNPGSVNIRGPAGADGEDGATFTPSVSAGGTLRWTNDKGLDNPAPVNVKGPKGDPGAAGAAGKDGYTPVRGTDYWTSDDIATIQSYIDEKAAALQSKSITDSGGYFHTDTVEGALQEIGAELAGSNTLLGSGIQISFTIDDETFSAVSGETWAEWVGTGRVISETSGLTLFVSAGGHVFADEAGVNALSLDGSTAVLGSDKIVSGATYTIISYGG